MLAMLMLWLLRSLSRGLLVLLAFTMALPATAGINDAVVMVNDCSGVCVDPRGIVLTVRHCDLPERVEVRFLDRIVPATRIYVCPESEGAVAYDCEGDGFPYIPIAPAKPECGDVVTAYGSAGQPRRLVTRTGPVLRGSIHEFRGSAFNANVMQFACLPGMSGGPIVNSRGEVVGLVSASRPADTVCVSWTSCTAAYRATRNQPQVVDDPRDVLLAFTAAGCEPCRQFKADYAEDREFAAAIDNVYRIDVIDVADEPELAERYGITLVPTFVVPNRYRVEGYSGSHELLVAFELVEEEVAVAAEPVVDEPEPESVTETETTTAMSPEAEEDASHAQAAESDGIDRVAALAERAVGIATWLGVIGTTGGIGGAVLGGLALWRTVRRRRSAREPPASEAPPKPTVITVDSAPPPQAIVPETRFAPYERDTYAEAFAWAEAEMARKYPGSVGTLESIKGLIDQYLAGKGYRPQAIGNRK